MLVFKRTPPKNLKEKKRSIMNQLQNPRAPKRNKSVIEMPQHYNLALRIHHAEGLDNPTTHPNVTKRIYCVVFWVHPGQESTTNPALGLPDPVWNESHLLQLDMAQECKFLYVEVLRCYSKTDPGSSSGRVVLGRARIPLPWLSTRRGGRFGLVRLEGEECKAEGHIIISLELKEGLMWSDN